MYIFIYTSVFYAGKYNFFVRHLGKLSGPISTLDAVSLREIVLDSALKALIKRN